MNKNGSTTAQPARRLVLTVGSVVVASLGVLAGGCGGSHLSQLKEAAAADMSCPKNRVHILTKSGKTRDVEACQQNATYRWEGDDWRMVGRGAAPAPGAAGAPVMKSGGPPGVAPAQPAPVMTPTSTPTGTPSQPPPSSPPPAAPGGKQI